MSHKIGVRMLKCLLLFLAAQTATTAETIEYVGRVYADRSANLLPMGSGDGAMTVEVVGIVAMSGNPPSVFTLGCAGLGLVDKDGKSTTEAYCRLDETGSDSIDLKGKVREGKGTFDVIGGSGKYAGATGSAKYHRVAGTTEETPESGTGVLELKVTTK